MKILDNHPWTILLIVVLISALIFAFRFSRYTIEKPHLKKGYNQLLVGYLIVGLIPTLIVFLADFIDGINFKKNTEFNYWSLSLQIYGLVISLVGLLWVFLRNGAEFLSNHPGLLRFKFVIVRDNITSVFWIKSIFSLISLSIFTVVILKWFSYFNS